MPLSKDSIKNCLIITYGPVPTSQYQTVEGGGMRVWGLAQGLQTNGVDVVVAVNNSFPQEISVYEGIRLINWGLDDTFTNLINSYDAVIISYCMGEASEFVANHIKPDVQLILDAYVPIYVEVSAREAHDIDTEYEAYMGDIARYNKVLKRGDYFLCASETQKTYYMGVLSSLGIVNPRSYREDRILVVPFGIHNKPLKPSENPYEKLGIQTDDFVVLWFGGLYPWFRVEELLDAMLALKPNKNIKFVFVGAKNPFNPHPDFSKQYDKTVSFAKKHKLTDMSVFFVDWVDFDKRINWYAHADFVISLNQPGDENKYSWRTRVMDYVWGELVTLTNGGDPLSEDLIAGNAAIRLKDLSSGSIVEAITALYENRETLDAKAEAVHKLKPNYFWEVITKPLALVIGESVLPYAAEQNYRKGLRLSITASSPQAATQPSLGRVRRLVDVAPRLATKVRRKGIKRSAKIAANIVRTQVQKRRVSVAQKRYIFISHPMNNTGAPVVLIQIIEEFARSHGGQNILLVTAGIEPEQERRLRSSGVRIDKAVPGVGFRFIRVQLGLRKNDFVLMNTAAIHDNYRDFIMLWLKNGRLDHAYWFIHEDKAQLPIVHKEFLDKHNIDNMHKLMAKDKLTVFVPSKRTKQEYDELIGTNKVRPINLQVVVDKKFIHKKTPSDYSKLNFLISGTPSDGRKGQMLALAAFQEFKHSYYSKDPAKYRDFKLHLLALGDDYISQQLTWIGQSLMKEHVITYPSVERAKALEIAATCNAVICCSLNETFALYVAEGMFMGQVVVRNNSAGVDEQLKDGVNGYFIDHTDIVKFAVVLEKLLNKQTNSDEALLGMGQASKQIIADYSQHSYLSQF